MRSIYDLDLFPFFLLCMALLFVSFYAGALVRKKFGQESGTPRASTFLIEGTLLSMLLSFTFGIAAGKYDQRRSIIADEINAISTAMLRIQLYPDSISADMMEHMKAYLDSRIEYFEARDDEARLDRAMGSADSISRIIFKKVAYYSEDPGNMLVSHQMVPALNKAFDIISYREIYREATIPLSVLRLLLVLSLVVSFLNGYNQEGGRPNWIQAFGFFILITFAFMLILDLNNNRSGYINLDKEHRHMIELRKNIDKYK